MINEVRKLSLLISLKLMNSPILEMKTTRKKTCKPKVKITTSKDSPYLFRLSTIIQHKGKQPSINIFSLPGLEEEYITKDCYVQLERISSQRQTTDYDTNSIEDVIIKEILELKQLVQQLITSQRRHQCCHDANENVQSSNVNPQQYQFNLIPSSYYVPNDKRPIYEPQMSRIEYQSQEKAKLPNSKLFCEYCQKTGHTSHVQQTS